ncbi:hypothetical protein evm_000932 [Chilo suppressalis]|nr:hypothetical protein evm_000932 [Chilo suppressalis]
MELLSFADFIEFSRRIQDQGLRRYLRDYSDPFRKYTMQEFISRYRFTPATAKNVLVPLLEPHLRKASRRGLPFPPEIMLLAALRYYATGSFRKLEGDCLNICQQSMSRIVSIVSMIFANQMKRFVKLPLMSELSKVKNKFFEIGCFPSVIGCIGCIHIKIKSPGGLSAEVYRNRKGWFSVNVQAVTGPNLQFFDLVVRWPGSCHNSFIFNNSRINQRLHSGELQGILLGDNGYAVSPILMTPYLAPSNPTQEKYNKSHIKTRNSIDHAFKVWKHRFPCLQVGMAIKLQTTVSVICACAALHNIAISCNDGAVLLLHEEVDSSEMPECEVIPENINSNGFIARDDLAQKSFSSVE